MISKLPRSQYNYIYLIIHFSILGLTLVLMAKPQPHREICIIIRLVKYLLGLLVTKKKIQDNIKRTKI